MRIPLSEDEAARWLTLKDSGIEEEMQGTPSNMRYKKLEMNKRKIILDACCGGKMFWFDKNNKVVLFADMRDGDYTLCDGRIISVRPDIVTDFRNMPFPDNYFKMVVFDPPHLIQAGPNGWMAKRFGSLPKDGWQEYIKQGFDECWRVLDNFGSLIFKWNETDIPVSKILEVIEVKPLFGHKSGKQSRTYWMCFMKLPIN